MCSSKKKIHGRSLEIPRLSGGSQKLKSLKESMKLTGISGGWEGVQTKKPLPWRGYEYFLELNYFLSVLSFLFLNSNLIIPFPHVEIIKF